MPYKRPSVRILNPVSPDRTHTSHRRALRFVAAKVADWVEPGVSIRLFSSTANPAAAMVPWQECWRTAGAAVLQPYQPYQRGV